MWEQYIRYLKEWANEHSDDCYEGMSPACYEEWLDNENEEYEDDDEDAEDVRCFWCEEKYSKDECKYELNMRGYLCPRCRDALWTRGEKLRYRET